MRLSTRKASKVIVIGGVGRPILDVLACVRAGTAAFSFLKEQREPA
jgi:hypothetical protein